MFFASFFNPEQFQQAGLSHLEIDPRILCPFYNLKDFCISSTKVLIWSQISEEIQGWDAMKTNQNDHITCVESYKKLFAISTIAFGLAACSKESDSFSILSASEQFNQATDYAPRPVDILWVVDNSGSMQTSQDQLAANFAAFISDFQTKGYDFRIAVGTSDAYSARHYNNNNRAKFKTGSGGDNTNTPVIIPTTPNLIDVFQKNVRVGITGSGDERPLDSMRMLLSNPLNATFPRPGAYLAVVVVTDEEDYTHGDWWNGLSSYFATAPESGNWVWLQDANRTKPTLGLTAVSEFKAYLDGLTGGNSFQVNYSVSSIAVQDATCKTTLETDGFGGRRIADRVNQLATDTGGQKLSICGNFGTQLSFLTQQILSQANTFRLNREPIESTIVVRVNGSIVAKDATNGWTYHAPSISVIFHGSSIPAANAVINIAFDPAGANF